MRTSYSLVQCVGQSSLFQADSKEILMARHHIRNIPAGGPTPLEGWERDTSETQST